MPEYALEEIEAHKDSISRRNGLSIEEIDVILSILLENITIVPASVIKPSIAKADKIIGHIDPFDVPFVALYLSLENDGIWSNDKHFENIKDVKALKTADLCDVIGKNKLL